MYTDMYQTQFDEICCFSKTGATEICWKYGDTVFINFQFQGIQLKNNESQITITFYNSEFEEVYTETFLGDILSEDTLNYTLDSETAKLTFKPGIYYCGVRVAYINEGTSIVKTVVNPNKFKICVI